MRMELEGLDHSLGRLGLVGVFQALDIHNPLGQPCAPAQHLPRSLQEGTFLILSLF